MKYYSRSTWTLNGDETQILSEDQILDEYWSYWYDEMCNKYGKQYVDETYTKDHCIEDWVIVNWAYEVEE
jgi:hypothetical protein